MSLRNALLIHDLAVEVNDMNQIDRTARWIGPIAFGVLILCDNFSIRMRPRQK